jgi:hypothetical protein
MLSSVKNGWDIAQNALDIAGGGGTYVLHRVNSTYPEIRQMKNDGWDVFGLDEWESLIEFARIFSRKQYGNISATKAQRRNIYSKTLSKRE